MTTDKLWEEEEKIRQAMGAEALLEALERAMPTSDLEDLLAYIARHHEIETELEEKE